MFSNPLQNNQSLRPPVQVKTFTTLQLQEEIKSAYKHIQIAAIIWFLCNLGAGVFLFLNMQSFQPTLLIIDYSQIGFAALICLFVLISSYKKTLGLIKSYTVLIWIFIVSVIGRLILLNWISNGAFDDTFLASVLLVPLFFPVMMLIRSTNVKKYLKRATLQGGIRL
jgi:hypothetical protein